MYAACLALVVASAGARAEVEGWLNWRGPGQDGVSLETGLPDRWTVDGENHLWSHDLPGRGTPVIAGGRVYAFGYAGEKADLQEVLICLDAATGKPIWERRFNDFISDVIYSRYSIGSPAIDAETGNVYLLTSPGLAIGFSPDGKKLWEHSLMEEFGRLTFPNGRTGSPVVDHDLVIYRGITANWGGQGPARDRFYAFDKRTGEHVWASTPGVTPQDSSYATPVLAWLGDRRVFYCGTGCGNVVCINARNGEPLWRFELTRGGVNATPVLHGDRVIAIHDKENVDSSETGRMVAIDVNATPEKSAEGAPTLPKSAEAWRNPLSVFSSSPVIVGDRVYTMVMTGELCCVDVSNGKVLWQHKLGPDQLHASPLAADGKLYIPMHNGTFYIIRPSDAGAEVLSEVKLAGNCLGAPSVWNGRMYVHTTEKLYCFGKKERPASPPKAPAEQELPAPGEAKSLGIVPSEVLMRPGHSQSFSVRPMDANGLVDVPLVGASWEKFVPPTAKVKAEMDAEFNNDGVLVAGADAKLSAGAFQATLSNLKGEIRGRILPNLPFDEDFESFAIAVPHETEQGVKFAYPPLPWIGARFKWEVRERDGSKVLAKTLDRLLFQRTMTFIGHADESGYSVAADVMSDGNRRLMSDVGVINQRYIITLKGTWQELEVQSNHERVKVAVPFEWKPKVWYRLKTRVDVAADGSGVIRGKVWPRDEAEPDAWTIEVPHKHAHAQGAPGLFGFSPQSQFRVYIDNISVTPNGK